MNIKDARDFIEWRLVTYRKDFAICLTPDASGSHAYMPAVITCLALFELFSGLLKGRVSKLGVQDLKRFRDAYMRDLPAYQNPNLELLHFCFRNKIAHLGTPLIVFDTDNVGGVSGPRKLVTWTIHEGRGGDIPALELRNVGRTKIQQVPTPWPVYYDHRMTVDLANLNRDLLIAIDRYSTALAETPALVTKFSSAVESFYPR